MTDFGHHYRGFGLTSNISTWGCFKIENRSIDLIQVEYVDSGVENGGTDVCLFNYVVLANVVGLEEDLASDFKPVYEKTSFFGKEEVGKEWIGGQLAQRLRVDLELETGLASFSELERLEIRPHTKQKCVSITPVHRGASNLPKFLTIRREIPTREAFEAYDKIALHIRDYIDSAK